MVGYNLTAIGDVNNTLQFTQNINTVLMNDQLGNLILITLTIMIYMGIVFSTKRPVKAWVATSFISFIMSILLFTVGLIPSLAVWITLIMSGISVAFWNLD